MRKIILLRLICPALALLWLAPAAAGEYFDSYDISPDSRRIDIGIQPMAYPLAFTSAVMQRDQILAASLAASGHELKTHPFRKGNDQVALVGGGRLEVAFLGDMPTINTAVRTPIAIAALGKKNFSSVVAREAGRIEQLRGKRIGYSAGSSSHYVLLQGLKSADMSEQDVVLVALEPSSMPDALESGQVDAFSGWEPTPSISLARNPKNRAIYRGMSTDWIVFSRDFVQQQPQQALMILASYVRAINWMRANPANLRKAAAWVIQDGQAFLGKAPPVTSEQAMSIARKDLLDVAGAPAFPAKIEGVPILSREFDFLKQQGKIPGNAPEDSIRSAFAYDGLRTIQAAPKRYRIYDYEYRP